MLAQYSLILNFVNLANGSQTAKLGYRQMLGLLAAALYLTLQYQTQTHRRSLNAK